jgi:hypothetical protein
MVKKFDPLLIEFWRQQSQDKLDQYFTTDGCISASQNFLEFLDTKGLSGFAEIIPIGYIITTNGKQIKAQGWFHLDHPVLTPDALTSHDIRQMRSTGLNPKKRKDRKTYIYQNNLEEEFRWVPHSWVELRGRILDPSGFYIDGESGQFDRLVENKSNLTERYRYF